MNNFPQDVLRTEDILLKLEGQTRKKYSCKTVESMRYFYMEEEENIIFPYFWETLTEENQEFLRKNRMSTRFFVLKAKKQAIVGVDFGTVNSTAAFGVQWYTEINCQGTE